MAEGRYDDLVRDLATLGRGIDPPVPSKGLATAVMDRVAALPTPDRPVNAWTRVWRRTGRWVADIVESRRRRIALVVGAVLLALLATPTGARGRRRLVRLRRGAGGAGLLRAQCRATAPRVAQDWSVSKAAAAVDFTLSVPEELGEPDGVEVSPDRRLVSMSWATDEDGVVRLDQFDTRFDFSVLKRAPGVFYAAVGGTDALWFEEPHEVVLLEPDGSRRTESARLAGHTLIWLDDVTTLRLEGDLSLERAVEIAESCVTVA